MRAEEIPLNFKCQKQTLIGILHRPQQQADTAVLVVVGGPQYRTGSHRQFVLLARYLSDAGLPVLRFDYRAMGDSEGEGVGFEGVNSDISAAIDTLYQQVEGLRRVVIWGLCDAASAALFYAHTDPRVAGLVLLNPWVRTEAGEAKTYLKHYYLQRLMSPAFWKKLLAGRWQVGASFKDLFNKIKKSQIKPSGGAAAQSVQKAPFPERMMAGLESYKGRVLFILSGNNDYVADEFRDLVAGSRVWQQQMARDTVELRDFPEANHTFSSRIWRDRVAEWTRAWVVSL